MSIDPFQLHAALDLLIDTAEKTLPNLDAEIARLDAEIAKDERNVFFLNELLQGELPGEQRSFIIQVRDSVKVHHANTTEERTARQSARDMIDAQLGVHQWLKAIAPPIPKR